MELGAGSMELGAGNDRQNKSPGSPGGLKEGQKMRRFFRKNMAVMLLLAVFLVLAWTLPASAAYSVKQQWVRFTATAGEDLDTGEVVCIKDSDGEAYQADANDADLRPAVGIVGLAADDGDKVEIIAIGILRGWTTLSEGGYAYLSETAAAVTQSAPTYEQIIGVAISTTEYFFNFSSYLDTSALTALGVLSGATPIILEGATADAFENTFAVTDPTADRTTTFPDAGGTVMLSSLATNGADAANAVTGASNGLVFEGATADAFETTLTVTDPTGDRTITLPDYTGGVPLVIVQGTTQTSQGDASTVDVTGTDLSIAAGWLTAGKTLKWTVEGTITNGNDGDKSVSLYLSAGTVLTLSLTGATGGDYIAEIYLYEHTDDANQDVYGSLLVNGQSVIFDRAATTTDVSGAVTAKLQLTLTDAADTITVESYRVETWTK
jgi:hypothetical protein